MTIQGMKPGPRPSLGQMGPMIGGEELSYREAVRTLEGIKKAYAKLIVLLGQEKADLAIKQAKEAVEKAQEEFVRKIPQR